MSKKVKTSPPTVTIEGEIESIEGKDTAKGDFYATMVVRVDDEDDELVKVTAYEELAEACCDVLKEGSRVRVTGTEKQERFSRKIQASQVVYLKTGESLG